MGGIERPGGVGEQGGDSGLRGRRYHYLQVGLLAQQRATETYERILEVTAQTLEEGDASPLPASSSGPSHTAMPPR